MDATSSAITVEIAVGSVGGLALLGFAALAWIGAQWRMASEAWAPDEPDWDEN